MLLGEFSGGFFCLFLGMHIYITILSVIPKFHFAFLYN